MSFGDWSRVANWVAGGDGSFHLINGVAHNLTILELVHDCLLYPKETKCAPFFASPFSLLPPLSLDLYVRARVCMRVRGFRVDECASACLCVREGVQRASSFQILAGQWKCKDA